MPPTSTRPGSIELIVEPRTPGIARINAAALLRRRWDQAKVAGRVPRRVGDYQHWVATRRNHGRNNPGHWFHTILAWRIDEFHDCARRKWTRAEFSAARPLG